MVRELVKEKAFILGVVPQDIDGVAMDGATAPVGDAVCLKDYGHVTFVIMTGLTPDARTITLKQSTSAALGSEKALAFDTMYANVGLSTGLLTKTAVTSDTFNTAATANNVYVIEVNAETLDSANSFDWVRVNIATGDTSATIAAVLYILGEASFAGGTMPDPIS